MAGFAGLKGAPRLASADLVRRTFILTAFLGSFLLFFIQPMFARMLLPSFGGAPAVWNVALVFYQIVLLAGYAYAHLVSRLAKKKQLIIHLCLFALAATTLPLGISKFGVLNSSDNPTISVISVLALSIGPLFFVISSQAPLIQAWLAASGHPQSRDPYFLYSASNVGSMLALLCFPLLAEPYLGLSMQALIWSGGFVLLALLTMACGSVMLAGKDTVRQATPSEPVRRSTWRERGRWILFSAVPSGLLLSTTSYLTTDIMAMPLLWVVPLALYLLTFVLAFGSNGERITAHARRIAPFCIVMLAASVFLPFKELPWLSLALQLTGLFYIALAIHGRLSLERPEAGRLTEFYLFLSLGGAAGGAFCALLAPVIFNWTYEHPLLLFVAALCVSAEQILPGLRQLTPRMAALVTAGAALVLLISSQLIGSYDYIALRVLVGVAAVAAMVSPAAFAVTVGILMLMSGGLVTLRSDEDNVRARSFFGSYYVKTDAEFEVRKFVHGVTTHGLQDLREEHLLDATTYYGPGSGAGQVLANLASRPGPTEVGLVGLGVGTLACYKRKQDDWTVYEIDPLVVRIARDPRLFRFLENCAPDIAIETGDGRLLLEKLKAPKFDVLVIDAFSSDAIPLHLMTVEAFEVYRRSLKPDGILLLHISNRFLDLEPVVQAIARETGLVGLLRWNTPSRGNPNENESVWIALAPSREVLNASLGPTISGWRELRSQKGLQAWDDDWASIVSVLKFSG